MCILFIAVMQHPDYPLIIAANRDEFHNRATRSSSFWQQHPNVLAGQDLQAGGTWMGMTRQGYLSALTNVRDPQKLLDNAISRGELVKDFLINPVEPADYLLTLESSKDAYNGYNLLFGHWKNLWVYNNHTNQAANLTPGVYGLSNADLNSPWPKINQGVNQLKEHCQRATQLKPEVLFDILLNQNQAADHLLPETGVPIEWERKLSSVFIKSPEYGTRSSTLLLIDNHQNVTWLEHVFDAHAHVTEKNQFEFTLP